MDQNNEIKNLAEQYIDEQISLIDEQEKRIKEQQVEDEKQQELKKIKDFQNDNMEFDFEKLKKMFYEAEYFQEIYNENIEEKKMLEEKNRIVKKEYIECNNEFFNYIKKMDELKQQLSEINDKQKKLDGKLLQRDIIKKQDIVKEIEELQRIINDNNKRKDKIVKDIGQIKQELNNINNIQKNGNLTTKINEYKKQVVKIFEYCINNIHEIKLELKEIDKLIRNESNKDKNEKYFFEYVKLMKERKRISDNYNEVINLIKKSPIYDEIKVQLDELETKINTTNIENNKLDNYIKEEQRLNDSSKNMELNNTSINSNLDYINIDEINNRLKNFIKMPNLNKDEKEIWIKTKDLTLDYFNKQNAKEFDINEVNKVINNNYNKLKSKGLDEINNDKIKDNNKIDKLNKDYWERNYPGNEQIDKPSKKYNNRKMTISQIAAQGALFTDEDRFKDGYEWMTVQNAKNLSKIGEINNKEELDNKKEFLNNLKNKLINKEKEIKITKIKDATQNLISKIKKNEEIQEITR